MGTGLHLRLCRIPIHTHPSPRISVEDAAQQAALQAHIEAQGAALAQVRQVLQIARRVGVTQALPE